MHIRVYVCIYICERAIPADASCDDDKRRKIRPVPHLPGSRRPGVHEDLEYVLAGDGSPRALRRRVLGGSARGGAAPASWPVSPLTTVIVIVVCVHVSVRVAHGVLVDVDVYVEVIECAAAPQPEVLGLVEAGARHGGGSGGGGGSGVNTQVVLVRSLLLLLLLLLLVLLRTQ